MTVGVRVAAAAVALLAGTACGGSTPSAGQGTGASCRATGAVLRVVVKNTRFSPTCLAAAGTGPVVVEYENQDAGIAHNLGIYQGDPRESPSAPEVFRGDLVTGPTTKEYRLPSLPAGSYHFQCDIHPNQMFGVFLVEPG